MAPVDPGTQAGASEAAWPSILQRQPQDRPAARSLACRGLQLRLVPSHPCPQGREAGGQHGVRRGGAAAPLPEPMPCLAPPQISSPSGEAERGLGLRVPLLNGRVLVQVITKIWVQLELTLKGQIQERGQGDRGDLVGQHSPRTAPPRPSPAGEPWSPGHGAAAGPAGCSGLSDYHPAVFFTNSTQPCQV